MGQVGMEVGGVVRQGPAGQREMGGGGGGS